MLETPSYRERYDFHGQPRHKHKTRPTNTHNTDRAEPKKPHFATYEEYAAWKLRQGGSSNYHDKQEFDNETWWEWHGTLTPEEQADILWYDYGPWGSPRPSTFNDPEPEYKGGRKLSPESGHEHWWQPYWWLSPEERHAKEGESNVLVNKEKEKREQARTSGPNLDGNARG